MSTAVFIIFIGALILGAHLFNGLFSKTKIPTALILLLIGVIAGPVTGIITPDFMGQFGNVFTTMTLILLLFDSGINLKLKSLVSSFGSAFSLTIVNFVISAAVCAGIAYLLVENLDVMIALFFGVIVAGTSSAIVIPVIRQLKLSSDGETLLTLESALSDVFCLVIGLALLAGISKGDINFYSIGGNVGSSFFFAGLIGISMGFAWSMLINAIRHLENYFTINLAMLFIVFGVSEYLGYNGGIATLLFGIALANAHLMKWNIFSEKWRPKPLLQKERSFTSELVFIFSTFFFVFVGLQIQFNNPMLYVIAVIMLFLLFALRPFMVKLTVRKSMPMKDYQVSSIMIPKGLVPAILATLPLQLGHQKNDQLLIAAGTDIQSITYAIVFLSIILISLFSAYFSKGRDIEFFNKLFPKAGTDLLATEGSKQVLENESLPELAVEKNESEQNPDQDPENFQQLAE